MNNDDIEIKIIAVKQAKYLGQFIDAGGSPANNDINLSYLNVLLSKFDTFTKTIKSKDFSNIRKKQNKSFIIHVNSI